MAGVPRSASTNGRRRPSQSTNVPDFSTAAATGSTTSARSVTAEVRSSRLTTNRAASMRGERRGRVGQVVGVDTAHEQRADGAGVHARRGCQRCPDRGCR